MDVKASLEGQLRAGLKMLRQCVERCPEQVWLGGSHPRTFWRIAYHSVFFAHLYLVQNEAAFSAWPKTRQDVECLWATPPEVEPYTRDEIMEYIDMLVGQLNEIIQGLDLDSPDSGFPWYPNMPKLDHELMSIRHLQGHVGQLSELLMANGIDTEWFGRDPR
jgi:hypothetical protein